MPQRGLVLKELGMTVSKNTASVMSELDRLRVQRGERELLKLQKKARQRRESDKRRLEEAFAEEEGPDQPSELSCPDRALGSPDRLVYA
ncbi:hypothetical protein J6590_036254 [Homalodisca vitripennis]|nr:hypothetical protein J6590_036254 [Homalodisca vitripennis]